MIKYLPLIILSLTLNVFAQNAEQLKITGNKLIGKKENGILKREVIGNVVIKQKNVVITCDSAIQYLEKNEAELIGNVIVNQDTIQLKTNHGFYYGDSSIAFSNSGLELYDGHINLSAKNGYYYFDEERAIFYDNVFLKDSAKYLFSDRLNYFHIRDYAEAIGNVFLSDTSSIIIADSLNNFRKDNKTFAYGNVELRSKSENVGVFGRVLINDPKNNFTKINGNPFLIQIDTLDNGTLDTLILNCKLMESYSDSSQRLIATDSVRIWRGNFSSRNDKSIFYRQSNFIEIVKEENSPQPVLWFEDSQLSGDSIQIKLERNELKEIEIIEDGLIVSKHPEYDFRYDQMSGDTIQMFFDKKALQQTNVNGNVLSIYYMFEEDEPNGLIKSSSEDTKIKFDSSKVASVNMYGSPETEFHPENLIENKEKDFTIPSFIVHTNRPQKFQLLSKKRIKLVETNKIKFSKFEQKLKNKLDE